MTKCEKFEQVFIGMALMMAKECHISKRDAFNAFGCWSHRCCDRLRTGRDLRTGKLQGHKFTSLGRWDACPAGKITQPGSTMCRECESHIETSCVTGDYVTKCNLVVKDGHV